MYDDEEILDEIEIATEGTVREYTAENEDEAVYVPMLPGLAEMWFFHVDGHFAIVKNDFGDFGLAEPSGDETEIDAKGFVIDFEDGPLTEEGLEEVVATLEDHHAEA